MKRRTKAEKLTNELIEKFMPFVNGWKECIPLRMNAKIVDEHDANIAWYWEFDIANQKKEAIKCAIKHCDLLDGIAFPTTTISENRKIYELLEKMLVE